MTNQRILIHQCTIILNRTSRVKTRQKIITSESHLTPNPNALGGGFGCHRLSGCILWTQCTEDAVDFWSFANRNPHWPMTITMCSFVHVCHFHSVGYSLVRNIRQFSEFYKKLLFRAEIQFFYYKTLLFVFCAIKIWYSIELK